LNDEDQLRVAAARSFVMRDLNAALTSVPRIQSLSLARAARFPAGGIEPMRA
jgi:hypothetical protein